MKGIIELRFIAPNVGKLRTRVSEPAKNLSEQVRGIIAKAVAEVAEASQYEIKAKVLKALAEKEAAGELKFNNATHRSQVFDITSDMFSTAFAASKDEFLARFPSQSKEKSVGADDAAEDTKESAEDSDEVSGEDSGDTADLAENPAPTGGDEFDD